MTCNLCGAKVEHELYSGFGPRMKRDKLCFTCVFWTEYVEQKGDPRQVIVKGSHYWLGPDKPDQPDDWKGFGGTYYKILFNDGRVVETHDLWYQGVVPEHFKNKLADNAEFASA